MGEIEILVMNVHWTIKFKWQHIHKKYISDSYVLYSTRKYNGDKAAQSALAALIWNIQKQFQNTF